MGDHTDMTSLNLASRLAKKFQKAVYVSINVPSDRLSLPAIEKHLQEEIKAHPEKFDNVWFFTNLKNIFGVGQHVSIMCKCGVGTVTFLAYFCA